MFMHELMNKPNIW